ncbi:uncharacterized protein [Antedon mediterranea]|uniref:uncharacterized protein n=1 Tax=Antedon mediterranea TaxID=105859 RepID=UPI003AF70D62
MSNSSGFTSSTPPGPSTKRHSTFVWTPVFPENLVTPCMRSKHAACLVGSFIYVFGGRDAHSSRKDLWRYNITTNVWTSLECFGMAPPLLQDHTMVNRDNKLYIFGGELGFGSSDETALWSYDLQERSWAKEVGGTDVKKPLGRRGHTATLANDVMYIYGGYLDLKGSSSELWLYDFESDSWHIDCLSHLNEPPPRHNHSAVLHNNAIWIYGGLSNRVPRADLWKWDIDGRSWLRIRFHQGPTTLSGHSACVHNDCMFIFGGEDGTNNIRNDLWTFSFVTQNWSKISPFQGILPSPSLHHTLLPVLTQVHLNPNVQYKAVSVPHLQPSQVLETVSPPRPYSSPPGIERTTSPHGSDVGLARVFQNRVKPTGLLSPTAAAEYTVIVNKNVEEDISDILFHRRKLNLDGALESNVTDENENATYKQQTVCTECNRSYDLKDQCNPCYKCGDVNNTDRRSSFSDEHSSNCQCEELQIVDLEDDIDYQQFTEQTQLLSTQNQRIIETDQSNGFYNNGYVSVDDLHGNKFHHTIAQHGNNIHQHLNDDKKTHADGTETSLEKEDKLTTHQRNVIPKIIEPSKQRQYGRSNTVNEKNKQNGNNEWCLARDKQGYYTKEKQGESVLCMFLIGGKEGGNSNGITGIKTPLAMWKCGVIPGKPSPQGIRKIMTDMTI